MKNLGYHNQYKYAHDYQGHTTDMETMPKQLERHQYYYPTNYGKEVNIGNQMRYIEKEKQWKKHRGEKRISNFKPM